MRLGNPFLCKVYNSTVDMSKVSYRLGLSKADASILCTAQGGNNTTDSSLVLSC